MRIRITAILSAVVGLGAALPAGLAAQVPPEGITWSLYGLEAGSCTHFLTPWDQARDRLPSGQLPSRADQTPGLESALAREIAAEPKYAGWVPARFCWFAFDSAQVGNRWSRVKKDTRRLITEPVAVGYWALAVVPKEDSTSHSWAAVSIFSTSGDLEQSLVPARYDVASAKVRLTPMDSTADTRYEFQFDKNLIEWDGHRGDPVPVPYSADTLSVGQTFVRLTLSAQLGDSAFEPLGNLRLSGKGDLAKAMAAGPIRMVAPVRASSTPLSWHFAR